MDKLLLCPFCGKPPKTCPDTSYGEALVFCPDENECAVSPSASADLNDGETLDTAISAWNTRSLSPAPEGVDATAEQVRMREALIAAYEAGATDVHEHWAAGNQEREADFGEAARDYADAALTPPPKGQNDG